MENEAGTYALRSFSGILLYQCGSLFGISLVLESLFTVPPLQECYFACNFCGPNNNLLASALRLDNILPPISEEAFAWITGACCICNLFFVLWLLENDDKAIRPVSWMARQVHGLEAWSCVFLVFLINSTNACFGVWAVNYMMLMLLGLVNLLGEEEDAIDVTEWVFHQSLASAVLVAVLQQGWSVHVLSALVPALASFFAMLVLTVPFPSYAEDPEDQDDDYFLLPVSVSDISISSSEENCGYIVKPEHDMSTVTYVGAPSPSSLHEEDAAASSQTKGI